MSSNGRKRISTFTVHSDRIAVRRICFDELLAPLTRFAGAMHGAVLTGRMINSGSFSLSKQASFPETQNTLEQGLMGLPVRRRKSSTGGERPATSHGVVDVLSGELPDPQCIFDPSSGCTNQDDGVLISGRNHQDGELIPRHGAGAWREAYGNGVEGTTTLQNYMLLFRLPSGSRGYIKTLFAHLPRHLLVYCNPYPATVPLAVILTRRYMKGNSRT